MTLHSRIVRELFQDIRKVQNGLLDFERVPESLGVDVFATVRKLGYPIDVLSSYDQEMNRYAFLMIE